MLLAGPRVDAVDRERSLTRPPAGEDDGEDDRVERRRVEVRIPRTTWSASAAVVPNTATMTTTSQYAHGTYRFIRNCTTRLPASASSMMGTAIPGPRRWFMKSEVVSPIPVVRILASQKTPVTAGTLASAFLDRRLDVRSFTGHSSRRRGPVAQRPNSSEGSDEIAVLSRLSPNSQRSPRLVAGYPLTAPERPPTMRRSAARKKISAGIIPTAVKARIAAVSCEYSV